MADEKWGGAREGAGRKATGSKTRHYTVNLPIEVAEMLEKQAEQNNMSINKYLRHLIEIGGKYNNVSISGSYVDDSSLMITKEKKRRKTV